jgi:hypothetical protein
MPKFIYSLGVLELFTLGGIIYLFINKNPSEPYILQIFLLFSFIFLFLGTSIISFLLRAKKISILADPRKIYRKGMRKAFFLSLLATGIIGLKVYNLLSPLTGFLLIAFGASLLGIKAVNRR